MTAPSDRHVTLTELMLGVLFVGAVAAFGTEVIGWPRELALAHAGGSAILIALAFWFALKNSEASLAKRMSGLVLLAMLISFLVGCVIQPIYTAKSTASFTGIPALQLSRPDRSKYKGTWDELERPTREFMATLEPELSRGGFAVDRRAEIPIYQLPLRDGSTITIEYFVLWGTNPEPVCRIMVNCDTAGWPSEQQPAKQTAVEWAGWLEQAWKLYSERFPDADLNVEYSRAATFIRPYARPRISK